MPYSKCVFHFDRWRVSLCRILLQGAALASYNRISGTQDREIKPYTYADLSIRREGDKSSMKQIVLKQDAIHRGSLILVNALHGVAFDRPEVLMTVDACAKPWNRKGETHTLQKHPDGAASILPGCSDEADSLLPACSDLADSVLLEKQTASLLDKLMQEIGGWDSIIPVSGWRSIAEQQAIWDSCLRESGPEYTQTYVALPGHSEHQTGLAIDLGLRREQIDFICPEFPGTGVCGQFRKRAADYGFILRYPAGKEAVTGIGCEPWHFRYVGIPHARIMEENRQTLEEYIEYIRQFDSPLHPYCIRTGGHAIYVSYIPATQGETTVEVNDMAPFHISGNNVDGFVLTQWA